MKRGLFWLAAVAVAAALGPAGATARPGAARVTATDFDNAVTTILGELYQPNYVPVGFDNAFPADSANPAGVLNIAPAQDYTSGSVPGDPDHPNWPTAFKYKTKADGLMGPDGAPLRGYVALHPGQHPGIVVVHGFNTNGKESVIRWAAMLYANGYNVIASDQRDFKDESNNGESYPGAPWLQTFGWKEAQDVVAAAQYLKNQPGVTSLGIVGFSEGAQNTILAMANDSNHLFSAGITFSPPSDQNWQIYSTAAPPGCQPPNCTYPATDTLVNLVVPPYGNGGKYFDPCAVLTDASTLYGTTPAAILGQEKAFKVQPQITVPLLNFYSADDSLVPPAEATILAGYESGNQLQRTILVNRGEHAYFFDRWWQQKAILDYFGALLAGAPPGVPTVNQTPGGAAMSTQSSVVTATPAQSDSMSASAPLVCASASPTAVVARSFSAVRRGDALVLRWRTAGEAGIAGFDLYRGSVRLNRHLLVAGGTASGRAYSFRARPAHGVYRLVVVRLDGTRTLAATTRAT